MSRQHIPALDGVRGIAILTVLAFHLMSGAHSGNALIRAMAAICRFGWSGVTLFFILSGFLITRILWDTRLREGWWKSFYIRRTLRIAPLYYATLAVVLLSAAMLGQAHLAVSRLWIYALYLQNIPHFAQLAMNFGSPLFLFHFWSLAVEEQFYLVWPFLITRVQNERQAKFLCLSVVLLSFFFRLFFSSHWGTASDGLLPVRAGELALGAYLSFAIRGDEWKLLQRAAPFLLLSCVAAILLGAAARHDLLAIMSLFWGSFLVISLGTNVVQRAMVRSPLRWLGTISYGLYVFHVLLLPVYWLLVRRLLPQAASGLQSALVAVITVCSSLALAQLSFRFFETPILRLRSRFQAGREKLPIPPVHSAEAPLAR